MTNAIADFPLEFLDADFSLEFLDLPLALIFLITMILICPYLLKYFCKFLAFTSQGRFLTTTVYIQLGLEFQMSEARKAAAALKEENSALWPRLLWTADFLSFGFDQNAVWQAKRSLQFRNHFQYLRLGGARL